MAYSSSNPAFNDKAIESLRSMQATSHAARIEAPATIQGTVNKTAFLMILLVASSAISWIYAPQLLNSGIFMGALIAVFIAQLVMTFAIVKNPMLAKPLSIVYALTEGVFLGAISFAMERLYPNIVFQAVLGTSGVIFGMLAIYKFRIIKVTENFKIMVAAATMGIFFVYLISFVLQFFGIRAAFIHEGTTGGIIFSLVVIGVAAMNLAIDFDFIEKAEEQKAPGHYEWYGAFGLMLTIIWLYIEILRLLSKSRK